MVPIFTGRGRDFAVGADDPDDLLATRAFRHGRDWHQDAVAEDARAAIGHRHGGGHAGQRADALGSFGSGANFERPRRGVGDLGDLADFDGKLQARRAAELGKHFDDVGPLDVGGHHRFGDVDDDFDFVDILKADDGLLRAHVLPLLDEPLGDHAVVGSDERRVLQLDIGFDDAAFKPADLALLREDVFLAADGAFLGELDRGFVFFDGDAVGGFDELVFGAGDGAVLHEPRGAVELGLGVGQSGRGLPHLRFAAEAFFGAFAGASAASVARARSSWPCSEVSRAWNSS